MRSEEAVAVVGAGVGTGAVGNAPELPLKEVAAVRHVNASVKVENLQKMLDERALLRRVQARWENWKRHDAATFIRVCMLCQTEVPCCCCCSVFRVFMLYSH